MPIRCREQIQMVIDIVRRLEVPESYSVRGLSVRSKAARRLVSQECLTAWGPAKSQASVHSAPAWRNDLQADAHR